MRLKTVILVFMSAIALSMQTQPDVNSRLKALYIFNFTNMVEWPAELKKGSFNIGLFGESGNLYTELSKYNSKSVGSQQIKVSQYNDYNSIPACHILFVSKANNDKTAALVKKFKAKSTLVITESEGAMKDGSIINFIIRNQRQSYELSKTNASKHKLLIGKQLTELAVKVE